MTLEPSGIIVSNVYLGFAHQTINISKTFRNTPLNLGSPIPDYINKKYHVSGYLFIKPSKEQFDSELTYLIDTYVDDFSLNPYEALYAELKKKISFTVDC